jgi:hypothetical protein
MGLPNKCGQGHIHFGSDCPFCLKVQRENEELYSILVEGDGLEGEGKL